MKTLLLIIAMFLSVCFGSTYNFAPFTSSNYHLNGDAHIGPDGSYLNVIDINTTFDISSAFFTTPINALPGFSVAFSFLMVAHGSYFIGDGFTFALSSSPYALGTTGGSLAYHGSQTQFTNPSFTNQSIAIEFDNHQSVEFDDPNNNHIGIDLNASVISVITANPPYNMATINATQYVWIDYEAADQMINVRMSLTNSKPTAPLLSYQIDLSSIFGSVPIYAGFTGADGIETSNVDILSGSIQDGCSSASCFCAQQALSNDQQGYYCDGNGGFYQCLGGQYNSQSAHMNCAQGTHCGCNAGVECSCGLTQSPCVANGQSQTCPNSF